MLMKTRPIPGVDRSIGSVAEFDDRDLGYIKQLDGHHDDLFTEADRCGTSVNHEVERRLYARGSRGGFAYVIASGLVRFERVTAAGNRRITRIAGTGDLIGQEALLDQGYRDDAIACTPVALRRVSAAVLNHSGEHTVRLSMALMCRWQETLDESEFWSTEVVAGPARRRVLQLLARLNQLRDEADLIWLPKREQMGDMLNLTIETCSRVLSALRRDGVLRLVAPRQAHLEPDLLAQALAQSNH